jgi:hypothetical protein
MTYTGGKCVSPERERDREKEQQRYWMRENTKKQFQ